MQETHTKEFCSKMLYKLSEIGTFIQLAGQWTQKYCYS